MNNIKNTKYVSKSNLQRDIGYPEIIRSFPQYLQENLGIASRLGHFHHLSAFQPPGAAANDNVVTPSTLTKQGTGTLFHDTASTDTVKRGLDQTTTDSETTVSESTRFECPSCYRGSKHSFL